MLKGKCKKELMKIHPNKAITCTLTPYITAKFNLTKKSQKFMPRIRERFPRKNK